MTINNIYESSLFAHAIYADFNGHYNTRSEVKAGLKSLDDNVDEPRFSDSQAEYFFDNYEILHQYIDHGTGFQAGFIKNRNTGEITFAIAGTHFSTDPINDVIIADVEGIFAHGVAYEQIVSMLNYYLRAISPIGATVAQFQVSLDRSPNGQLLSNGYETNIVSVQNAGLGLQDIDNSTMLSVTGHSLGGHLAQVFTRAYSGTIRRTDTFNSAFLSESAVDVFLDDLGAYSNHFADNKVTNIIGDGGLEVVAASIPGVRTRVGDSVYQFIESQGGGEWR